MYPQPEPFSPLQPLGADAAVPASPVPPQVGFLPKRRKVPLWAWIVIAFVVFVVVIACGVLGLVLFLNNSPAKAVVQDYYAAVEKQDYAKAYTYLDIQTLTAAGQQLPATQETYIQASQELDQIEGKVTAYSIIGIEISGSSSTGNTASITVSVTRGGKMLEVHVQLRQIGNNWKIVGVDHL
jgi:hypothetical protein